MSFSLSDASIPVLTQMLSALHNVILKSSAHCAERKLDPTALLQDRLFPNMWTFTRQVNAATMWAANIAARLSGVEPPKLPEGDSFDDLKARVEAALAFVKSVDTAAIDKSAETVITFAAGPNTRKMKGKDYLLHQSLPNFYFHCATAYNLMRTNGVELSKRDFMGVPPGIIEG